MMKFCINCGNNVSESLAETCDKCGFQLSAKKNIPSVQKAKATNLGAVILMIAGLALYSYVIFDAWDYPSMPNRDTAIMIAVIGMGLHAVTLISYIHKKSWSLAISVINLSLLNLFAIYRLHLNLPTMFSRHMATRLGHQTLSPSVDSIWSVYLLIVFLSLSAAILNAMLLTNAKDTENKAFWMKINATPTERDNTLFKMGCTISAIVMGACLFMPFFSIDLHFFSHSFSFFDVTTADATLRDMFGIRPGDIQPMLSPALLAFGLLVVYILALLGISRYNSKAVKTTIGITAAISIAALVYGAQTIFFNAIESILMGIPYADSLGLVGFITNSIGNIFTSIVRLEIGVWVLLGSLAAYILFASCQLSRIGKPKTAHLPFPQATQVIKVRCIECGNTNDENATFCNGCGKPLVKEISKDISSAGSECANCGAGLNQGMNFCNSCGKAVDSQKDE